MLPGHGRVTIDSLLTPPATLTTEASAFSLLSKVAGLDDTYPEPELPLEPSDNSGVDPLD